MTVAIVLADLRAEGGPALAADLASQWRDHDPVVLCLHDGAMDMADRFTSIGVPVEVLHIPSISLRHYPRIAAQVAAALRRHRASAVVSIPSGVHGAIFEGARRAGIARRVVHVGNYPWHWQAGFWKYRLLMRLSAPWTPDLVCVTDHVRAGVARHFGHVARRLHVIPNGIDPDAFAFRPRDPVPDTRPIEVVTVARLDSGKDHATLIDAIQALVARGVDVRLTLAGDGTLRRDLETRARDLGDRVRFLGARRDVPDLLDAADVFAFPVRPEEGLGIALVEAMAAGLPIVATDVGACREVLDGGRCGALVPENDPQAMADAILAAARTPDADRIAAARARVADTYSRAAMAAAYGRLCGLT